MSTIKTFIKKHSVLSYYALTFIISWGGILLIVGPRGFPGTTEETDSLLSLFVVMALFAGPSISGIFMTGLVHGRAGFRNLLFRLLQWRVAARWYALALLFSPFLVGVILLALWEFSPEFIPGIVSASNKVGFLLFGITWGLIGGGLLEELGWTGFVVPELRRRYSPFTTGLLMGLLWGVWHLLITIWMSGTSSGAFSLAIFLPGMLFHIVSLTAFRVLLVCVYDGTGSLLVVMLMHASLSSSRMILNPPGLALLPGLIYDLLVSAALWVVVAAVHRQQTLPRQARRALPG